MEIVIVIAAIAVLFGIAVIVHKRSSGGQSSPTRGGGFRDGTHEQ